MTKDGKKHVVKTGKTGKIRHKERKNGQRQGTKCGEDRKNTRQRKKHEDTNSQVLILHMDIYIQLLAKRSRVWRRFSNKKPFSSTD